MTKKICLVTTGQPSTNPRLVKEADALAACGYDVHVIGAHWAGWADRADADLLSRRAWSHRVIDWRQDRAPWLFWKTRVRHYAARRAFRAPLVGNGFATMAASRLTPELTAEATAWRADLYIAHNLGALPAAAAAAKRHGARLGFDAEDFHRGQCAASDRQAVLLVRSLEERYLPLCDYVTAASPGIAAAYAGLAGQTPVVVLNVFSLSDRPAAPEPRLDGPLRLYWFSQTIGRDRGLEDMVAALGQVADRSIELHLRGEWQPGFATALEAAARAAGVAWSRIVRHAPAAPGDMVRLAAEYDAGLALEAGHTANADLALSNKIFTYVLAGIPSLASATTAQSALVDDLGPAAVLTPVGDVAALAHVLRRWAVRPEALSAARRAAWHFGTTRYNWEVEQHAFLTVVRNVLGDAARRRVPVSGLAS